MTREKQLPVIRGSGLGGSSSSSAPQQAPNTLQANSTAYIIDVISEGNIVGLVNGLGSVFFNQTPIASGDNQDTINFNGVSVTLETGTNTQQPVVNVPDVENEVNVGIQIVQGNGPIAQELTNPNLDACIVKIAIPALYETDSNGNIIGSNVSFQIELSSNGSPFELVNFTTTSNPITISGKCTSTYEAQYYIPLPAGGYPWTFQVTRLTADNIDNGGLQNQTWLATYTEIISVKLQYLNTAYTAIIANAELFGSSVPQRAYEIQGLIIQVPSNYNPVTRQYTGIWNGTFNLAYCNNPAWVLYDILTNNRYGLGQYIQASQIDKFGLYSIAQYCDALVPDGMGGMEPRYTFNGIINTQADAYQVINSICSNFMAMSYWGTGVLSVVQDSPADPIKLVTPANVIDGNFDYQGTALKARHTAALVTWNDPNNFYVQTIAVVENPEGIQKYGWRPVNVAAIGCTSWGQAIRTGKWILDTEWNQTDVVTYRAGLDHADLRPGDIIAIQDPAYAGIRYGGRITTPGNSSVVIEIDAPVQLNYGETYTISVVLPDQTIGEATVIGGSLLTWDQINNPTWDQETVDWDQWGVSNPFGLFNVLNLSPSLSQMPLQGAIWMITSSAVSPRQFRVISVRETNDVEYEITAIFYDPGKFARVEDNITIVPPNYTTLAVGALTAPTNLAFQEYLYQQSVAVQSGISVSWVASTDPRVQQYDVFVQNPGETAAGYYGSTSGTSLDIQNTTAGVYTIEVRATNNNFGIYSPFLAATFTALGLTQPPQDVQNFTISVVGTGTYLTWTPVTNLDLDYYVIKFSPVTDGSATWASSSVLIPNVASSANSLPVQTLVGTYLIKAVNTYGVESIDSAEVITTIGYVQGINGIITYEEDAEWGGICTDCGIIDGNLELVGISTVDSWTNVDTIGNWDLGTGGISSVGQYVFAGSSGPTGATIDLGSVFTPRLVANVIAFGSDLYGNMDLWSNVDNVLNWDGGNSSAWNVSLQISTTSGDPSNPLTVWTPFANFIIGDYTARAFRFQILLQSSQAGISPVILQLQIQVNMVDRVYSGNNILSSTLGNTITYPMPYYVTPGLGITASSLSTGDYYTLSAQSADGFTITFYNSSNVAVQRNFNWISKGY